MTCSNAGSAAAPAPVAPARDLSLAPDDAPQSRNALRKYLRQRCNDAKAKSGDDNDALHETLLVDGMVPWSRRDRRRHVSVGVEVLPLHVLRRRAMHADAAVNNDEQTKRFFTLCTGVSLVEVAKTLLPSCT